MNRKIPLKVIIFLTIHSFVFQHLYLFIPGVLLCIAGKWSNACTPIGFFLLAIDLFMSITQEYLLYKASKQESDNSAFNEFMDAFCDPDGINKTADLINDKLESSSEKDSNDEL